MKFCQTLFDNAIPSAVKSIITKELIEGYGHTQEKVAEKLGITQAAVSQYYNGVRGKKVSKILSNAEMAGWVKKVTAEIASGNLKIGSASCDMCSEKKKELDEELHPLICLLEVYKLRDGK